jgi:hypothetical protein
VGGATRNAEQIELFSNARQSETSPDANTLTFADYMRQVEKQNKINNKQKQALVRVKGML